MAHGSRRQTSLRRTHRAGHADQLCHRNRKHRCELGENEHRDAALPKFVGEHRLLTHAEGSRKLGLSHAPRLALQGNMRTESLEISAAFLPDHGNASASSSAFNPRLMRKT